MPLVLAIVFIVMNAVGMDLHRITLGALIIALGLLVGRRHHRGGDDGGEDGAGLGPPESGLVRLESTAFPMLTGTLVTAVGFLPVGFANSIGRRVCRRYLLGSWRLR